MAVISFLMVKIRLSNSGTWGECPPRRNCRCFFLPIFSAWFVFYATIFKSHLYRYNAKGVACQWMAHMTFLTQTLFLEFGQLYIYSILPSVCTLPDSNMKTEIGVHQPRMRVYLMVSIHFPTIWTSCVHYTCWLTSHSGWDSSCPSNISPCN